MSCPVRCLMAKADELSADDIVDRSEYAYIQTWTDEEIRIVWRKGTAIAPRRASNELLI